MPKSREKIGVILALIAASIHGLAPLIINRAGNLIPPLTFAAITTVIGAIFCFIYVISENKLHELKIKKAWPALLLVSLFIVIIPHVLFFVGSSKTSGINTALLGLSEIIFALIFTPFIGEKNTPEKLIGSIAILIGGGFILYKENFSLNLGDALIIFSTALYPIGNFYAKKAFHLVSPSVVLFTRFFLGGIVISILARIIEPEANIDNLIVGNLPTILFTGIIFLGIGKAIWYQGLKRLDMSKAISLIMTAPLFSVIFLITIFRENLIIQQWLGIAIMAAGIYFTVKRKSVAIEETAYAK